jgi:hypothetical protein
VSIPLWNKVIKPKLDAKKKKEAEAGRIGKRGVEYNEDEVEQMVEELLADEDFMALLAASVEGLE